MAELINKERYVRAAALRASGLTYKKVGEKLGVSADRARQMVLTFYRLTKETDGSELLSTRARNALMSAGIDVQPLVVSKMTEQEVMDLPNCGPETVEILRTWLRHHRLEFSA